MLDATDIATRRYDNIDALLLLTRDDKICVTRRCFADMRFTRAFTFYCCCYARYVMNDMPPARR